MLCCVSADVHKKTKGEQQAPIHYAAKYNAIDSLRALLELDANILERDYKQRMPLHVAAESGSYNVPSSVIIFVHIFLSSVLGTRCNAFWHFIVIAMMPP